MLLVLCVSGLEAAPVAGSSVLTAPVQGGIQLDGEEFDWVDIVDDSAVFRWSAEVRNETDREVSVSVVLELLNDDDQSIHSSSVDVTLQPGQSRPVQRRGSLSYDTAANVVSYRFRVDAEPAGISPARPS